jgi:hypothetical protein
MSDETILIIAMIATPFICFWGYYLALWLEHRRIENLKNNKP